MYNKTNDYSKYKNNVYYTLYKKKKKNNLQNT